MHTFICHASPDKSQRVRPLVMTLAYLGHELWVDRPGMGEDGLGLSDAFIREHGIRSIPLGSSWSLSIQEALRESSTVLACLSKNCIERMTVIRDELTFADTQGKLLTCIVDDTDFHEFDGISDGLLNLNLGQRQSVRVDCDQLLAATEQVLARGIPPQDLAGGSQQAWEVMTRLSRSIKDLQGSPTRSNRRDLQGIADSLAGFPVGPMVHVGEVPLDLFKAIVQELGDPGRADSVLQEANAALELALPQGFTRDQILTSRHELPDLAQATGRSGWSSIFKTLGLKGRRSMAALLMTPACRWAAEKHGAEHSLRKFLEHLEHPTP